MGKVLKSQIKIDLRRFFSFFVHQEIGFLKPLLMYPMTGVAIIPFYKSLDKIKEDMLRDNLLIGYLRAYITGYADWILLSFDLPRSTIV